MLHILFHENLLHVSLKCYFLADTTYSQCLILSQTRNNTSRKLYSARTYLFSELHPRINGFSCDSLLRSQGLLSPRSDPSSSQQRKGHTPALAMDWIIHDELGLTVGHVVSYASASAMVIGGIIPYVPQWVFNSIPRPTRHLFFLIVAC